MTAREKTDVDLLGPVRLSECGSWATTDGTPFGPVSDVRCPDTTHCLNLAPCEDGRIGAHDRNHTGRCRWIGSTVLDDRHTIARGRLFIIGDVIGVRPEVVSYE
ncbi:hypothetical protein AB0L97_33085 [Nocardia sp. NPDC051911]|uniref:hypothetical protein n=1 Tax=Nocardia sp. NPDC051911 TaxID=3154648 RepID=UPI00341E835E